MARIDEDDARAWAEAIKLPVVTLDANLEDSTSTVALAKLAVAFDTSTWISPVTTPEIVRSIIAMQYVSVLIQRAYATDEDVNDYALWLYGNAESLIMGLIAGSLSIDPEVPTQVDPSTPLYYPTDASSAQEPTADDPSLGGPVFTLGKVW
jgi:hypothetical protein